MEIKAQNLSKRFNREWIFRGFDYTFSSGNTYAITGPNGSGKSTLLQVLWGQMPPSQGSISYIASETTITIDNVYQYTSIATPYMDLIDELTLNELLQFHFKMKLSRNRMSINDIINAMQLDTARNKHLSDFSSGMRQRVKLGLAFFTDTPIIFLDEPGTNLDNKAFEWYLEQLNSLPETTLVLIASNQPSEYPRNSRIIDIFHYK